MRPKMAAVPSIPEFYSGRKIFVTGGTGFMGKVLIEKLLRSCPDLDTIFLLIRPKRGKRPEDRIQDITRQALFDSLRRDDPGAFHKLRAISGDVKELGLGLSVEDREMLQREVSIVFHSAASIRFTDPIKDSIIMNVRGTREVVNLALGMENLQVFLHLSTSFSNICAQGHVEEKIYPPPNGWDWKEAIKLVEVQGFDGYVNCLTPKILSPLFPNTYVFAKALGEQLINEHRHKLPVVIVRPSIVVGAFEAPLTGWIDNLNGPYGLWASSYTGALRLYHSKKSVTLNFVPVDVAAKSMIVIAWHRAISNFGINSNVPVYNCTSMVEPINQGVFHEGMLKVAQDNPTTKMIWFPKCQITECWPYFVVNLMIFNVLPGVLLDWALTYKGRKPMFSKINRRIYTAYNETRPFVRFIYTFDNSEFLRVADDILVTDREEFGYSKVRKQGEDTLKIILFGMRNSLLQDPQETMPEARIKQTRFYWIHYTIKSVFCLAIFWALTTSNAFHKISAPFAW